MVFFKYPIAFLLYIPVVFYVIFIATRIFLKFKKKSKDFPHNIEAYHMRPLYYSDGSSGRN